MRRGEGIVGLGETLRIETSGSTRVADAAAAWTSIAAAADIDDRVGLPGTGLVAFGAFAFAHDSASTSVLVVPELLLGRRDGRAWVTRITLATAHPQQRMPGVGAGDQGSELVGRLGSHDQSRPRGVRRRGIRVNHRTSLRRIRPVAEELPAQPDAKPS